LPKALNLTKEDIDSPEKREKYTVTLVGIDNKAISTGLNFARAGFKVKFADEDQNLVKQLSKGNTKLGDRQAESEFKRFLRKEQIAVTSDMKAAIPESELIILTTNARVDKEKKINSMEVEKICRQIGSVLQKGSIVVYSGVSGFGFTESIIKESLENTSGLKLGDDFSLAYIYFPNSLDKINNFFSKELMLAANDKVSLHTTSLIFETLGGWKLIEANDVKTMELAVLCSAVRHVINTAIVNELAIFCEKAGIDYAEIANITRNDLCSIQFKPTINGENYRNEAYLLLESADNFNAKMKLPKLAMQINDEMIKHALNLIYDALRDIDKSLRRAKISVLGTTIEESSSEELIKILKSKGAKISRYHPQVGTGKISQENQKKYSLKRTLNEAVEGTDCLTILGEQEQIKRLNLKKLKALMNTTASIVDLVGLVDPAKAENEGFIYRGIGKGDCRK
jgi:nucleotide sugar dehydrogenase